LTGRWFSELFRGTELLAGVPIEIRIDAARTAPWADTAGLHLTPATGAWSFARALQALGASLRLFLRSADTPFVAHTRPHDVAPLVLGEVFAALPLEPAFHARARRQTAQKAQSSALRMRIARLLHRRHLALRIVVGATVGKAKNAFVDCFAQWAPSALGVDVPSSLAAVICAPSWGGYADDIARFSAFEPGDALAKAVVEQFDVDWWRNPKSTDFVRDWCQAKPK
jgi:hypothetical protein